MDVALRRFPIIKHKLGFFFFFYHNLTTQNELKLFNTVCLLIIHLDA